MWRTIGLAATVLLGGCESIATTHALGSLQAEYSDLVRTQAACQRPDAVEEACLSDFPAMYGLIEVRADGAIKRRGAAATPGERQITIGLYRLAAFAALKADSGNAAAHGAEGRRLCREMKSPPARDCALLEVVGQYEVVERYAADVNCLARGGSDCGSTWDAAATEFCPNVYDKLVEKTLAAKSQAHLPQNVSAYLDTQVERTRTSLRALDEHLTHGLTLTQRPRKPCDCIGLSELDPRFAQDCGNVPAHRAATFKAMCIRQSLDRDGSCPNV